MATLNDLNDVSAAFLTVALEALAKTNAGAPGRAYVNAGEPAMDCCGQCVIWIQDLTEAAAVGAQGALGPSKAVLRGSLPQITVFVQATRCQIGLDKLRENELPKPGDLQATATMVDQDGWALRLTFADSIRNGLLSRVCSGVEMLGGTKLTPQGGCVGWTFSFRYPIEGGKLP